TDHPGGRTLPAAPSRRLKCLARTSKGGMPEFARATPRLPFLRIADQPARSKRPGPGLLAPGPPRRRALLSPTAPPPGNHPSRGLFSERNENMNRRTWLTVAVALVAVVGLLALAGAANASLPGSNPHGGSAALPGLKTAPNDDG